MKLCNLIKARKSKQLSGAAVGKLVGISRQHYSRLELGQCDGSIKVWECLSKVLDEPIEYLRVQGGVSTANPPFLSYHAMEPKTRRVDQMKGGAQMSARVRRKTLFGQELAIFSAKTNLTVKDIAQLCGVNYGTLLDTTVGKTAGNEIIPKVQAFMAQYADKRDQSIDQL